MAAGIRDVGIFQELLREGGDLTVTEDSTGETALIRAADCQDRLIVGVILAHGSRGFATLLVQQVRGGRQGDSATALHLAAAHGVVDICRDLLEATADANALDRQSHMPLHGHVHSYGSLDDQ